MKPVHSSPLFALPSDATPPLSSSAPTTSSHEGETREERLVWQLKALAHPTRWRILLVLARQQGTICVAELVALFPQAQPTISHHLRQLHQAGLIHVRKSGLYSYYSISLEALALIRQAFDALDQEAQSSNMER